jgi:CBS domain containing-hemolysin-like protein
MSSVSPVLIIAGLILLNGLFVAAEFAIVGVPRSSVDRLAARGNRTARILQTILRDARLQDRFIATAQLGITLASLGLGMYGEHALAQAIAGWLEQLGAGRWIAAHTIAAVISITILTYLHIVVGEMVPKSLALQHAERTALWITPVMRAIQGVFYPLVVALNGIGNGLLRLVGIRRQAGGKEGLSTTEDIAYIVRESQMGGLLRSDAAQVMQELLEFGDLTVREVMVPRVRVMGLPLGATIEEIRRVLRTAPHTRYPVYEGTIDRIIGILHVKDLLRDPSEASPVTRERLRPVPFVPEASDMDQLLETLRSARSQVAVVMDEFGGTAGMITIEDLFEEVVGEFGEDPDAPATLRRENDGRIRVAGSVRLDELGEALHRLLEHEEVDTVGGLVLTLVGRPPQVGDIVTFDGVLFEVVRIQGHAVTECMVTLAGLPDSPAPLQ